MATIAMGYAPHSIEVNLARDSTFASQLYCETPYPDGTEIELRFTAGPASTQFVWPATVAGQYATWDVDPGDVAEVVDSRSRSVRLMYSSGGDTYLWGRGRAVVS